ncbi:MAG: STAS domain-containing protein [Acidimicrobiales bacterium]|nr:STAS domain-containing protein [Acidimicrobiales bacterium]
MSIVEVSGDLSPRRARALAAELEELCAKPRANVRIDLRSVRLLHLAGVNVIIQAMVQARRGGGEVTVALPLQPEARRPFELAGVVSAVA